MHADDYARGYVQGHRDGTPAKLRDLILGGPIAIIILGFPIGMIYLLFWLNEQVPAVHSFMEILNRVAGFGDYEDSGSFLEIVVRIGIAIFVVGGFMVFWMYSPWMLLHWVAKYFNFTLTGKSSEYQRGYAQGKADAQNGRPQSAGIGDHKRG